MFAPTISVVIPFYGKTYEQLLRAVESCSRQTVPPLEIVVVDDEGKPAAFFTPLFSLFPSFRLIPLQHGGPARARNEGIKQARGTHIVFVDADDYVFPGFFEHAISLLTADVDCVFFSIAESPNNSASCARPKTIVKPEIDRVLNRVLWSSSGIELRSCYGKVFSLSFLRRNNLCFPPLFQGEDVVFSFLASLFMSKIVIDPSFISYCYESQLPSSLSRSFDLDKIRQYQDEAQALLRVVETFALRGLKAQEAYYNIVCEIIPAAVKTVFCHPDNPMSFGKRYSEFKKFVRRDRCFVRAICRLHFSVCPTGLKRLSVFIHKVHLDALLFWYYNKKMKRT